jgi:hypothetical protein
MLRRKTLLQVSCALVFIQFMAAFLDMAYLPKG